MLDNRKVNAEILLTNDSKRKLTMRWIFSDGEQRISIGRNRPVRDGPFLGTCQHRFGGRKSSMARGIGTENGMFLLWKELSMSLFDLFPRRILRQIVPFMRIVPMIVQFFRTISITDITPPFATHRVISWTEGRDCGLCSGCLCVGELRSQGDSFVTRIGGETAKIEQRGVDVNQPGRLLANLSCREPRNGNNQGISLYLPPPLLSTTREQGGRGNTRIFSDHFSNSDELINWSAEFVSNSGALWLTHVESEVDFERYMQAIARIPELDTETARTTLCRELLHESMSYIQNCKQQLAKTNPALAVELLACMGQPLHTYRQWLCSDKHELLVIPALAEDRFAQRALTGQLASEYPHIALLIV